eukprot:CAMPEP_0178459256 /NCGR_PEP_ID=MMETSP0689_2-20121128/48021_1 /TAXON_ID=160604 /ORGANISM="Amphidinium massartii, Strain CS-259" /LENGTH=265 /DNA_ID=CAMNT_0020085697 /DNA_START=148 /DNA_END=945 /DNA_ORIENTATION=+
MVTKAGGRGIAVRCDHTSQADIEKLAQRVKEEFGCLDVLVNDVWGADSLIAWDKEMWTHSLEDGLKVLDVAMKAHIMTSHALLPLLTSKVGGVVVEVTDGDHMGYRGNFYYDLAKTNNIRMAFALHKDLSKHGCRACCITPGFLRSEAMLDIFEVTEENYKEKAADPDFQSCSETPYYLARGLAHLLAAPPSQDFGVYASWTLARHYGYTDKDGSTPNWGEYFQSKYGQVTAYVDTAMLERWNTGPMEALERSAKKADAPSDGAS